MTRTTTVIARRNIRTSIRSGIFFLAPENDSSLLPFACTKLVFISTGELVDVTRRFHSLIIGPRSSEIAMFQQLAQPFENAAAIFVLKISQSPRHA